jgi:uncharacterized protein YgiM (DUF1202 family)
MVRKKFIVTVISLILAICSMSVPVTRAEELEFGQITADAVKLREKADKDSAALAEIPINTEVEVLGEENGWYRVLYGDLVGYVRQDLISINSKGSRAAYVLEDGVKLRGGPSQTSYVVTELTGGQGVKIKQMVGEWYFVVANDYVGYVNRTYLMMTKSSTTAGNMLKTGMEGQEVKRLQTELNERGFLTRNDVTGVFGAKTRKAVEEFQKACDLPSADGVAGAETLNAIYDPTNKVQKENATFNRLKGTVVLLDWFKGGSDWLAKGSNFTITDVRTGLSFRARRFGGWYHADSEPVTAADTAVMKRIAGGKWSWNRRAIWVTIGGKTVAASMHCMPHMANPIKNNNFDGHFCVHLLNSKVHETGRPCPRHQAMVQAAYKAGRAG